MDRREFSALAGAAGLMAASGADAQTVTSAPVMATGGQGKFLRVYATPDGETHIEELTVADTAGPIPVTAMRPRNYRPAEVTWHHTPAKQFVINTTGWLETELSDGTRRKIGPGDLVYLEDLTGKGHVTRLQGEGVTCLFIAVPPDFDVVAWAKGAA